MTKTNFGYSVLDGGILIGAGTLAVTAGTGARFPSAGNFPCVIWDAAYSNPQLDTSRELVLCTSRSTDTLTITRAQESTSAKAWDSGSKVAMVVSAAFITQIETEITAKAAVTQPAAYSFTADAGWTAVLACKITLSTTGYALWEGLIAGSPNSTPWICAAGIPAAYRPLRDQYGPFGYQYSNWSPCRFYINTSGAMAIDMYITTGQHYINLCGFTYKVA